jgi:outer membrane protein
MNKTVLLAIAVVGIVMIAASRIDVDGKKFGYLDSVQMVSAMPEMPTIQKQIEDYAKELDDEYQLMMKEYRKLVTDYQAKEKDMTETMRKLKQEEIGAMEQKLTRTQQAFEQDLVEKQEKLLEPIIDKIDSVIQIVAKEKGLSYVFDTSKGMLLYADEADDLTKDVQAKLNIKPMVDPKATK